MAERAVDREPISEGEFRDLQGKYRGFARNRLPCEARSSSPSALRGPTRLASLNSETEKFLPTSRESRDAVGGQYVNLQRAASDSAERHWGRVVFYVSDVDRMHARALAAGLRPAFAPRDAS